MTKHTIEGDTLVLPLEAFLVRINRHLKQLIPYRELFYDFKERNYFLRVVNLGQTNHLETQGPYYYKYMVALARHINALSLAEKSLCAVGSIRLRTRGGSDYQEVALPSHLKFDVITPVLNDAISALLTSGYTVIPPLTGTVTTQGRSGTFSMVVPPEPEDTKH